MTFINNLKEMLLVSNLQIFVHYIDWCCELFFIEEWHFVTLQHDWSSPSCRKQKTLEFSSVNSVDLIRNILSSYIYLDWKKQKHNQQMQQRQCQTFIFKSALFKKKSNNLLMKFRIIFLELKCWQTKKIFLLSA